MKIVQLYTGSDLDNFTYIIHDKDIAYVVDPYDASQVSSFLEGHQLLLKGIFNTHDHWDHTRGNEGLVESFGCKVFVHNNSLKQIPFANVGVLPNDEFKLNSSEKIIIKETPGHTENHICLLYIQNEVPRAIFSGDTLFNAGVGNCRNGGNVEELYHTISNYFFNLPDNVIVYPGHDYIKNNLKFTLSLESGNQAAHDLQKKLNKEYAESYCAYLTNIGIEKEINLFFRLNSTEVRRELNMEDRSDKDVFIKLRSLRDNW